MKTEQGARVGLGKLPARTGAYVLLAVTTWVAFFIYSPRFGLYEDDYACVGLTMGMDGTQLAQKIAHDTVVLHQGRPIGFAFVRSLSYLGNKVGGLWCIYVLGFLVVAANSILFYELIRRGFPELLALFAGLVFCLFPGDTTKGLLTHNLILQPALMFMLVASHLYLAGKKKTAYIVVLGSLLSYESAFLPFLAVPLLQRKWDKGLLRTWATHAAVFIGLLAAVLVVRGLWGEHRVGGLSLVDGVEFIWGMGLGPVVSASSFGLAPVAVAVVILKGELNVLLALAGATALFFFYLRRGRTPVGPAEPPVTVSWRGKALVGRFSVEAPQGTLDAFRAFAIGLFTMPLAYALAFTHFPGFPLRGRSTSVHLAATVPAALLCGALLYALYCFCRARRLRTLGTLAIAAYLASLVAYGVHAQRDFVRSRDNQRRMFTSVVKQCPDLADSTLIFVEGSRLWDSPYVKAYSWSNPIVLQQLFRFPSTWNRPPRLFVVSDECVRGIKVEDGCTMWFMPAGLWESHWVELPQGNLIVFKLVEGELVRSFEPVYINGTEFPLKQIPPGEPVRYEKGHLYDYLISDEFAGLLPMR